MLEDFLHVSGNVVLHYCRHQGDHEIIYIYRVHKEILKSFVYVLCLYCICVFCVEKCSQWLITLPDTDSSTDSDLDSKPDSYVVLC